MLTIKKNKMVHQAEGIADKTAISFELSNIFGQENITFDEIRENDVSDNVLASILDDVSDDHLETRQRT